MFKVNITDNEFEQLKVLADYLIFDQHSERLAFPRFQECMGILTRKEKFPLKDIFSELCGENRKFITFPRLVRAFLEYKRNDKARSIEFKKFFGYVFNQVIKDTNQITGREIPGVTHFSTVQHKNRDCVTNFKVYSDGANGIQGLCVEYDELIKNEFLSQASSKEELNLKINLNLRLLEDFDNNGVLDENDVRDFITHIFGTYSTKIEFLGVKCSSGKMYYTGDSSLGTSFLLGKNEAKFHYIKMGLKDGGITYIKPFFTQSTTSNVNLNYKLNEITEEFLNANDLIYADEEYLTRIADKKDYLKNVLVPILHDDYFFSHDKEDVCGDDLCDVYSCASFCSSRQDEETYYVDHLEDQDLLENLVTEENISDQINYEHDFQQPIPSIKISDNWDKISPRTLNVSSLFNNTHNLEALVEKYRDNIYSEIEYKKSKLKQKEENKDNFYLNHINRMSAKKEIEPSLQIDKRLEREFEQIVKRSHDAFKNLKSDENEDEEIVVEYYEEDEFGNIRKLSGDEKKSHYPLDVKEVVAKWNFYSEFLKRKVIRFGISAAFGVAKAIEIMKNFEENFEDNNNPLEVKIKVFDILTKLVEKRRVLKAFSDSEGGFSFIKKKIISQINTVDENEAKAKLEDLLVKKENKSGCFKIEDLGSLSKNIEKIEKMIAKEGFDTHSKKALKKKLQFLKREKAILIDKQVEIIKKEIAATHNVDLKKYKKEQDEKRRKLIQYKRQAIISDSHREKIEAPPTVTFSELELPKDIEIYRSQEMIKGKLFTDDIFPPNKNSLCSYNEKTGWILPAEIEENDLEQWETFEWERVDKIFRSQDYQVFLKGIEAADIIQGSLGDCYFLSAVAGLCKFPELVERLLLFKEKSTNGCYGVYMRINGLWELILVDDFVPCHGLLRKKFAFSNANGKELWVILIEKAWAKLNGSYANAISGQPSEVFDAISNAYTETVTISSYIKDQIWNKIKEGKDMKYIMTAGTGNNSNKLNYDEVNLVTGHAYTVLSVEEVSSNGILTKLVKIRNPWGNGEWSGDWSDSSPKWTQKLRDQLLGEKADDGVFFMSFDDFIKYYVTLSICKIHRDFTYSFMKFKKAETKRPQVLNLVLEKDSKAFIQLHQKNPRFLLANGKYGKPTLAHLLIVDENFKFVSSVCGDTNNITIETELKAGKYYLYSDINYRHIDINEIHGYNITTYSDHSIFLSMANESVNYIDLLRESITDFCKSKIEPFKDNNVLVYSQKSFSNLFPFSFSLLENLSDTDVEVEYSLANGKGRGKTCCLFPETEFNDVDKLTRIVTPQHQHLFISLKFRTETRIETSWRCKASFNDEQLKRITLEQGIAEELDEDGNICQRYYQYKGGYGLILENKTKNQLNMKLEVENLSYNDEINNEIVFDVAGKSSMFFHLKVVPSAKSISFNFNFAD